MARAVEVGVSEPDAITCPACGSARCVPDSANRLLLICNDCGEQFFAFINEVHEDLPDDDAEEEISREDELDGIRIARMVKLKRAAYRTRSFLVVGSIASAVAILKLAAMTGREYAATGWSRRAILYVAVAAMCLMLVGWCVRRIHEVNRELSQS